MRHGSMFIHPFVRIKKEPASSARGRRPALSVRIAGSEHCVLLDCQVRLHITVSAAIYLTKVYHRGRGLSTRKR